MSWKMIGEPKTRKLTKALAEEFSGMTPAPHDRPLNATRSAVLRAAFQHGKFRTCEWATAYCAQTKMTYRINGKHTSTLLCGMNGEFPKDLVVVVEKYHCDTLEDVAQLYATFDTRASARSTGDINQIFAATCPELEDVSSRIINVVVSGIAFSRWEESYSQHPQEERSALIIEGADFALFVNELLGNLGSSKISHLRRVAVVAAMHKTWLKSKSAAMEFWKAVRDETGAKPDIPDRKLAKFLITSRISSKTTVKTRTVGSREVFVKCIHGWNAWRNKESTNLNFFPNAKTPAAI